MILWFLTTRFPAKIGCTAATSTQLNVSLWAELAMWYRRMPEVMRAMYEYGSERYALRAAPGECFAVARTARKEQPEAFQGLHSQNMLLIADEASGIPEEIFEAAQGIMATPNAKIVMTSNPTRNSGYFFEAFNGKASNLWRRLHVPCSASSHVPKQYLDEMAQQYGVDSDVYRVRVMGEFPISSELQFIPVSLVDGAMQREARADVMDPLVIGVDVARHGDDRTVIYIRKGRDGRTHEPIVLRIADLMQIAGRVAEQQMRFQPDAIFIDAGGMGWGVVDKLRELRVPCIPIENQSKASGAWAGSGAETAKYANIGSEMWGTMREWLKGGAIVEDGDLKGDLIGREYGFNLRNEIVLEPKAHMKARGLRSPDLADALALTFAYPVMPNARAGYEGAHRRGPPVAAGVDYDPFEAA